MIRQSIEVAAGREEIFALTQDYSQRLAWGSFLSEASLLDEAGRPGVGVKAWCVDRNGLGMETTYVSFNPPRACAVAMTRGPWFIRSFSASWRFDPIGPARTRVTFTYSLVGRPRLLTGPIRFVLGRETRRRLGALKRFIEDPERKARAHADDAIAGGHDALRLPAIDVNLESSTGGGSSIGRAQRSQC